MCDKESKHTMNNERYCRAHFLLKMHEQDEGTLSVSSNSTVSCKVGRTYCPACGKRGSFGFSGCTKQQLYCKEHRPYEDMEDVRHLKCCVCNKQATHTQPNGVHFCGEHMQQAIREAQAPIKIERDSDDVIPCTSAFSYDKKSGQFFNNARPEVLPRQEMPGVGTRGRPKDEYFQGYGKNVNITLTMNLPAV